MSCLCMLVSTVRSKVMREAYKLELTGNTELLQTARAALENEYIKGVNSDKIEGVSSTTLARENYGCRNPGQ